MTKPISKIHNGNDSTAALAGKLYVVATPIGNLDDISARALRILSSVPIILAEDTRHSKRLLNHFGINTRMRACHDHNESDLVDWLQRHLTSGEDAALISDAGTPLISDPGYHLVSKLRANHYQVVAVPGPSALIAALSIAGLPTDRFIFDGFLPAKSAARKSQLQNYLNESRTIVVFESSHRILASLKDFIEILGAERRLVLARELTKKFETLIDGTIEQVHDALLTDSNQCKGEFVLMLSGSKQLEQKSFDTKLLLTELVAVMPVKQACAIAAKLTGKRKNDLYDIAQELKSALEDE